jgi:hypothetical protein
LLRPAGEHPHELRLLAPCYRIVELDDGGTYVAVLRRYLANSWFHHMTLSEQTAHDDSELDRITLPEVPSAVRLRNSRIANFRSARIRRSLMIAALLLVAVLAGTLLCSGAVSAGGLRPATGSR